MQRLRFPLAPLALATAMAALTPVSTIAQAQTRPPFSVSITAQPLGQALNELARQARMDLIAPPTLMAGKTAPAVSGHLTVRQALDRLLAGSGLVADVEGDNVFVRPAHDAPGASQALQSVTVTAQAERSGRTENSGRYTPAAVAVGSKLEQSLRETPRSISVITHQQLQDQRITTLDEVMNQLPGVTVAPGTTGYAATTYYTRGFQITSFSVDGSPGAAWNANDTSSNAGMSKYDSVQLLRGPDGLFSGNGQPSGSVNLVRKKPLRDFQLKTTLSAGSWNNQLGEVDVTGRLIDSGHLRGRLVAAYNDREFFFDGARQKVSSLYGVLEADLGPQTVLTFGASQDRAHGPGRDGAPHFPRYANGDPLPIPRSQGYTRWSNTSNESTNLFASVDHWFNDDWKGRLNLSRTDSALASNVSSHTGIANRQTGLGSFLFPGTWAEGDFASTAIDGQVSGGFNLLGRRHQIVVGGDYQTSRSNVPLWYSSATQVPITDWANLDPDLLMPTNPRGRADWVIHRDLRQHGLYANGKFQLQGPLSLVLGGRYAGYKIESASGDASGQRPTLTNNRSNDTFTPYYALTYELAQHWTAFFSVAESFEDQSNYYTAHREPLDPTTGRSHELGLKGELWGGRANLQVTLYHAKRRNLAVRVSQDSSFDVPGRACCYAGDGAQTSRGIEIDLSGELARGWHLNAGYTFDDNQTSYGASDGLRYASYTPRHMLRLWSRYQLHGSLNQWAIGGGVKAQSNNFRSGTVSTWNPTGGADGTGAFDGPSAAYRFIAPGRAIWNSFVEYRFHPQWTAALNIQNLFDKTYYQSVGTTASGNIFGEPRSVQLTLRGQF